MLQSVVFFIAIDNGNHVKADCPFMPNVFHVGAGGISEEAFFARGDGFGRLPEKVGAAGFYFNKDEGFAFFGNKVNLGFSVIPVDFENKVAFAFKEGASELFADFANIIMFCQCLIFNLILPKKGKLRSVRQSSKIPSFQ